jgi:predicted nucleotidyltransferase
MDGNQVNREVIIKVAEGLEELRQEMVFVGGATLSLYADDPAASAVRPTSDIDLSVSLAGYGAWNRLQERLRELRFYPNPTSSVICRFNFEGITIDVMPDDPQILGFSNPWYQPGLDHSNLIALTSDLEVRILPIAYFLATKFSAYHSRGGNPLTSHDFEDIVYITDNRLRLVEEIAGAPTEVKVYLQEEYRQIVDSRYRDETLSAHLNEPNRLQLLLEKMEQVVKL